MATNKRTPIERESDLVKIAKLYFEGKTQSDIGRELNITQQQISYDLKTLQTRWVEGARALIDEAKGQELAKIDNLEVEYWQAYRQSQKEFRSISAKRTRIDFPKDEGSEKTSKKGKITELTVKRENRIGDAKYLSGVAWCIERRCKLLGLDAPNKQELSGPNGGPVAVELDDITKLTTGERATRFVALLQSGRNRTGLPNPESGTGSDILDSNALPKQPVG